MALGERKFSGDIVAGPRWERLLWNICENSTVILSLPYWTGWLTEWVLSARLQDEVELHKAGHCDLG